MPNFPKQSQVAQTSQLQISSRTMNVTMPTKLTDAQLS